MKKFKMPPALIIVMMFLFIVGILTWFVPTSVVVSDEAGNSEIIYNAAFDDEGNIIENAGTTLLVSGTSSWLQLKALPMLLMWQWQFWCPAVYWLCSIRAALWMQVSAY